MSNNLVKTAFANWGSAKRNLTTVFPNHGTHLVRIDGFSMFTSDRKGDHGKIAFTVLKSEPADGAKAHRVGEVLGYTKQVGGTPVKREIFQREFKGIVCAISGKGEEEFDHEDAEILFGEDQSLNPLVGAVVWVKARPGKVRQPKAGEPARKPDDPIETYTDISYSLRLTPDEVVEAVGEETVAKFFPSGIPYPEL